MKLLRLVGAFVGLVCLVPALMASDEVRNRQRVVDYWRAVWSEGDVAAVAAFYHPQCKHGAAFTIEGFQKSVRRQRESFPDFNVRVDEVFATGDRVVSRVTYRATHTGKKMFGQEPLGAKVEVPGIDIFVFKDGKCVEHHHVADHLDLVLQMGLTLTPKPPPPGPSR